ncbi:MAG: hypothetical protein ACEQSR_03820 [Candidatus Methylacidiphilales bacterium]
MRLTKKIQDLIHNDVKLRAKLMLALNLNDITIKRLVKNSHWKMTTKIALNALQEITGLTESEILEETTITA